jgi:signal peptidase I
MNATRAAIGSFAAGLLAACLALVWLRRRFVMITVKGHSMMPTYRDGQRLLVRRGAYSAHDVVVFRVPAGRTANVDWLVKRAVAVSGDLVPTDLMARAGTEVVPNGKLLVRSDAPEGIDSGELGLIDGRDVLGVVRMRKSRAAIHPRSGNARHCEMTQLRSGWRDEAARAGLTGCLTGRVPAVAQVRAVFRSIRRSDNFRLTFTHCGLLIKVLHGVAHLVTALA